MGEMQNAANYMGLSDVDMSSFVLVVKSAVKARLNLIQKPGEKITDPEVQERLRDGIKNPGISKTPINNTPILGFGKPGIGKTEVMRGIAQQFKTNDYGIPVKVGVKEVRLGSFQDTDITGLPNFYKKQTENGEKVFTEFAPLKLLPITRDNGGDDEDFGILVLDEITTCSAAVRTIALQLLDSSRALGAGYVLPDGWTIVALGNGENDGADFMGFRSTHISRFQGFNIVPNKDMWFSWARSTGIHPAIYGYLKTHENKLFMLPPETSEESCYQFPTPRTWAAASSSLIVNERMFNGNIPPQLVLALIAGCIGINVASEVAAFYKYKKDIIPLDEIFDGSVKSKHSVSEIKVESLYLGQEGIITEILNIGKRNEDKLSKSSVASGIGTGKSTFKFSAKGATKVSSKATEVLAPEDAKKIANIFKFIFWCENIKGGGALDWITDTITNLKEKADKDKNLILNYIIDTSGQFSHDCPEFQKFSSAHADLMQIVRYGVEDFK